MNTIVATLLIAFLAAVNCGLIGNFLVLRKQIMIGDAVSHAVLPGIVIAFLLGKSTNIWLLLLGAFIAGIPFIFFISFLSEHLQISHNAAIGIGFSSFFALGIVLLAKYAKNVDLDQECVLYGDLVTACKQRWYWHDVDMGSLPLYILSGLLVFNFAWIVILYPGLVISSFDTDFGTAIGMSKKIWHNGFIIVTTVNIVLIFRVIGAPLVVGFLVLPPMIAYLFNDRLTGMLMYTILIDATITSSGYLLAYWLNASLAGAMLTASTVLFITIFLLNTPINLKSFVMPKQK